ncbi:MAG: hypothetical protein KJ065_22305 [Anaerolineae bacterium]|nr:hypothetical protein [Anaerolineae bacterium]
MSTETPPAGSSENTSSKSASSGYVIALIIAVGLAVAIVLAAMGVIQRHFWRLETRVNAVSTNVPEIDARELLAEVKFLKEQLDSGINNFNSLIDWTQFVGIAVAVVAGVAAVVGLRDSRKDREELQERLKEARKDRAELQEHLKEADKKLEIINETIYEVARLRKASSAAQIGQRQLALDNLREAVRLFDVALNYSPDDETLIYLWADAWLRLKGKEGAYEAFKRLKNLHTEDVEHPSASALFAYSARLQGDQAEDDDAGDKAATFYKIAEDAYRSVKRTNRYLLDSFGESVFGGLAGLYRRQAKSDPKKRKMALDMYEECRKITPSSSYILNNLALLQYCEDPKAARETFVRCHALAEKKRGDIQNDYWAIFDSVTARIALNYEAATLMEDLKDAIALVRSRAQDDEPIKKFLSGLEELQCEPVLPALKDVIEFVRKQLDAMP